MGNGNRLPTESAAYAPVEKLAEETRRKYLANIAMVPEVQPREEQIDSNSDGEEAAAEDPKFEKFRERMERELAEAQDTEADFYGIAPDPVLEIFRDDLLLNRVQEGSTGSLHIDAAQHRDVLHPFHSGGIGDDDDVILVLALQG